MNELTLKAYAKINIGLDVTGKRADGYHLVDMVMQTVDIFDEVSVRKAKPAAPGVTVTCDKPQVPQDESNLACRAAALIQEKFPSAGPVEIEIKKNIPMAGGMAGGSTDAAAVLRAMDALFELNISKERMDSFALSLGADVPFCLRKGTWRARGVGEILKKLPDFPGCALLIVNPGFGVSTARAYAALDAPGLNLMRPDMEALCSAISKGGLKAACAHAGNVFEAVVFPEFPVLADIKQDMLSAGALAALMTGSGATMFGIFPGMEEAQQAAERLKRDCPGVGIPAFCGAAELKF